MQLLLSLYPTYSYFQIIFFLWELFPYLSPPQVHLKYPHHCSASLVAAELSFWFFKDHGKYLSYLWLKESHKHYTAFNHANLDHSLLTAWCLFKVIMLNRLLHKIISRLVKEGKHNLNYNSTCSLLWNYFSSCNYKILAIFSVFRIPV